MEKNNNIEKRYNGRKVKGRELIFHTNETAKGPFPINLYKKQIELINNMIDTGMFGNKAQVIRYCINRIAPIFLNEYKEFMDGEYINIDGTFRKLIKIMKE